MSFRRFVFGRVVWAEAIGHDRSCWTDLTFLIVVLLLLLVLILSILFLLIFLLILVLTLKTIHPATVATNHGIRRVGLLQNIRP